MLKTNLDRNSGVRVYLEKIHGEEFRRECLFVLLTVVSLRELNGSMIAHGPLEMVIYQKLVPERPFP